MTNEPKRQGGRGKMAPGYTKQGLQISKLLREGFSRYVAKWGQTGVRNTGSVAIALFLGLPEEIQDELYMYGMRQMRDDPNGLVPQETWREFTRLNEARLANRIRQVGTADDLRKPPDPPKTPKVK